MDNLVDNAKEFLESGEDNLKKNRNNAAVSDFFKTIVIFCDHLLYIDMKTIAKNHNDRFTLLEKYFPEIYKTVSGLFKTYTQSYNQKLTSKDARTVRDYAYELKRIVENKK